jgi:hypothetical protein
MAIPPMSRLAGPPATAVQAPAPMRLPDAQPHRNIIATPRETEM